MPRAAHSPPWFVYILRCADRTLYTGVTTEPERRVAEHNDGRGARYTRSRGPVSLVYLERAAGRGDALRREYEIKQMTVDGKKKLCAKRRGVRRRVLRRS